MTKCYISNISYYIHIFMKITSRLANWFIALPAIPLIGVAVYFLYQNSLAEDVVYNQNCIVNIYKVWPWDQLIKRWVGTIFWSSGVTVKHIFADFETVGGRYVIKNWEQTIDIKKIHLQDEDLAYFEIKNTRLTDCLSDVINDYKLYNKWSRDLITFEDVKIDWDSMLIAWLQNNFEQWDSGSPLIFENKVIGMVSKKNWDNLEIQLVR